MIFAIESTGTRVAAIELTCVPGWVRERTFDIPHGPRCSFTTPGGHRLALYQLTRPEVADPSDGRPDSDS